MPAQPYVMRAFSDTSVISVITRPAPPTASAPRWTRCQSVGVPSTAEYWHMGDTTERLINVVPRIGNGTNIGAGAGSYVGQPWSSAYTRVTRSTNSGSRSVRLS